MKTKILGGLLMIAVLAITSAAKADTVTVHKQRARRKLEHRITRDVRKGEITRAQARHFRKEEKSISMEKRMAINRGNYTPAKRMRIHRQQKMLVHQLSRKEYDNNRVRG